MDGQAIISVSAAVVALVQLAKWAGLSDTKGPLGVLLLSLVGVVFWGWSRADFTQATAFEYFAGWIAVMTSAAGVFGFTRATGEGLTKMRGTGDGSRLPVVLLAVVLTGGLLASGCGSPQPPQLPNVPSVLEGADQNLKAATAKGYDVLLALTALVNEISVAEDDAARQGVLPAAADQAFDAGVLGYVRVAREAQGRLRAGVASWAELKAAIDPVLAEVTTVQAIVEQAQTFKARILTLLGRLRDKALELAAALIVGLNPNLGGAR